MIKEREKEGGREREREREREGGGRGGRGHLSSYHCWSDVERAILCPGHPLSVNPKQVLDALKKFFTIKILQYKYSSITAVQLYSCVHTCLCMECKCYAIKFDAPAHAKLFWIEINKHDAIPQTDIITLDMH